MQEAWLTESTPDSSAQGLMHAEASPQVQPHNRHLGLGRMLLPDVCRAVRQIPCVGPGPYDVSAPHRPLCQKVRGPYVGHL